MALRFDNWKVVFMEQRATGTLQIWAEPFVPLRVPKIFNLRTDPVRARRHHVEHLLGLAARPRLPGLCPSAIVTEFLATFKDFPPRQRAASFTIDQAIREARCSDHQPALARERAPPASTGTQAMDSMALGAGEASS